MKSEDDSKLEPTGWGGDMVHIHTIADRKVKVLKNDGTEGEAMLSQVQAKLLTDANVPFAFAAGEIVRSVRDEQINARRKAGLPDLCEVDGCGAELSMSRHALHWRAQRSHPWACRPCSVSGSVAAKESLALARTTTTCEGVGCSNPLSMTQGGISQRGRKPHPWLCQTCNRAPLRKAAVEHRCEEIGCTNLLGQTLQAERQRRDKPHPWRCKSCTAKANTKKRKPRARRPKPDDRCDGVGCSKPLSKAYSSHRRKKKRPWLCRGCSGRISQKVAVAVLKMKGQYKRKATQ